MGLNRYVSRKFISLAQYLFFLGALYIVYSLVSPGSSRSIEKDDYAVRFPGGPRVPANREGFALFFIDNCLHDLEAHDYEAIAAQKVGESPGDPFENYREHMTKIVTNDL